MIFLVLGVVGLFKPLVNLRMANRKWAGAWIIGGFVVMMAAAVNAPPSQPEPTIADATNQGGGMIDPALRESAAIDACYDAANTDAAKAICDAQFAKLNARLDAEGKKNAKEMERAIVRFDRRSECIKRELGASFDTANQREITAARHRCGINDPENTEELLREQRERLSR
jgi:hypothetical protein